MNLKYWIRGAMVSCLLMGTVFCGAAMAQNRTQLTLEYDGASFAYDEPEVTLVVNQKTIDQYDLKIPPVIIAGRTYVPVRDVFEKMGAIVDWKEETGEVFIGYQGDLIVMQIGSPIMYVNTVPVTVEAAPKIINHRTMIPVKFASEALGFTVGWKQETMTVSISDQAPEVPVIDESQTLYTEDSEALPSFSEKPVSGALMAVDVSPKEISEQNFPETQITGFQLPSSGQNTQNRFTIQAASEISKVSKMLLEDNRLVIDIYHSEMQLSQTEFNVSAYPWLSAVRAGQNMADTVKFTRLVFQIKGPVSYSVSISQDRKSVYVDFQSNTIKDVRFSTDGAYDYVTIEGTIAPGLSVFTLANPGRIVMDVPLGVISESDRAEAGRFVTRLRTAQFESNTARIVAEVDPVAAFETSVSGNVATVKLSKPTYQNIAYDYTRGAIAIQKPIGQAIDLTGIVHTDQYTKNQYILDLPGDYATLLGYGTIKIQDTYIDSVEIQNVDGRTRLIIRETRIMAYDISEDTEAIYIKAVSPKTKYDKIVIIDPGHGGKFPGTSGSGLVEKDINLIVGKKIIQLLEQDGRIKVYATRLADVHLAGNVADDLQRRSDMANWIGDLFVSIHHNAFSEKSNGTETYYHQKNNQPVGGITSQKAADILQKNMLNALQLYDRKVQANDYAVLRNTKVPAVLVEVGFLSNPEEAAKLATDEYQAKAAQAIYQSILETFEIYTPAR